MKTYIPQCMASVVNVNWILDHCFLIQCSVYLQISCYFFKLCETECIMQMFQTLTCNIVVTWHPFQFACTKKWQVFNLGSQERESRKTVILLILLWKFTFMHLKDAFIQSGLLCIQVAHLNFFLAFLSHPTVCFCLCHALLFESIYY